MQSTDTMQCGIDQHDVNPESHCKWVLVTACRSAENIFWSMARKSKGALVWERDESPNQIRKQTWVEKGQLTPDVLNFPESHHCVPESFQHTDQLSVHGHSEFPTRNSE